MCDVLNLILMLIAHHNAGGGGRLKSNEVDSKLPYQAWPKVSDAWQRSGREVTTLI